MPLRLEADLTLESGGTTLQLQGSGQQLQVRVPNGRPLPTAGISRRGVARIAEVLARQGLTLDIVDGSGPLLTLGARARSRLGTLLFGTPRVALRRPLSLLWRLRPASVPGPRAG